MALPDPQLGMVISYSYLWAEEHRRGRDEGVKDRPCVIVLAIEHDTTGAKVITVAPLTHSAPKNDLSAIKIPAPVKVGLGLDDSPSWVVVTETNEFVWPGFDLRPISGKQRQYVYGYLPPRLFDRVARAIAESWSQGTGKPVPR